MILWTVKLLSTLRRAIAGRKYPHQLAWAVAFGLLLGVVPHGNLLAVAVLVVVLSLKLNHAMAALTAVGVSFVATWLDPYSHQVGDYVLTHPSIRETAIAAWQLPLIPWTDLNNTVVMGSFLIGVAALVPIFVITYPVFRMLAPRPERDVEQPGPEASRKSAHDVVLIDSGHSHVASPHRGVKHTVADKPTIEISEIDGAGSQDEAPAAEDRVAVETRIDVIRMKDYRGVDSNMETSSADGTSTEQPMDEALNYLLRQLRDSQQRKAA